MKVLALELSSPRGSLAWIDDDVIVLREWPNDRKNSGPFFDNLLAIRKEFGLAERIIVGLGPGSYAGIRIAISTAIGLEASSQAQVIGYPSICALKTDAKEYWVIGDARRQSFFYARVESNELLEGPLLLAGTELREKLAKLDRELPVFCFEHLTNFDRVSVSYPCASVLASLARESRHHFALPPLEPMYLRGPHVTVARAEAPSRVVR